MQRVKESHLSVEMAARQLRYDWFEQLISERHLQAVAVAHHQDDSIETMLINLIRGTGIDGLLGIQRHHGIDHGLRIQRLDRLRHGCRNGAR